MRKQFLFVTCVILVIAGSSCAQRQQHSTKVILKHPETQDFVTCNVDKWRTSQSYKKVDDCVHYYETKGYIVWGER